MSYMMIKLFAEYFHLNNDYINKIYYCSKSNDFYDIYKKYVPIKKKYNYIYTKIKSKVLKSNNCNFVYTYNYSLEQTEFDISQNMKSYYLFIIKKNVASLYSYSRYSNNKITAKPILYYKYIIKKYTKKHIYLKQFYFSFQYPLIHDIINIKYNRTNRNEKDLLFINNFYDYKRKSIMYEIIDYKHNIYKKKYIVYDYKKNKINSATYDNNYYFIYDYSLNNIYSCNGNNSYYHKYIYTYKLFILFI